MSLNLAKENRIYKKLFNLKQQQKDGLILNVHHTDRNSRKIRFVNSCFNKFGQILVLADHEGNLFVVDFNTNKFWNIPKVISSCTVLRFSNFKENEVLIGSRKGSVTIIDVQTGFNVGNLIGHKYPVVAISFASDFLCLTSSEIEAMIWDLKTNTKVQVLNLNHNCNLKIVVFIPVTSNILACFDDDIIQIWQFGIFELKVQIPPLVWYNHSVKNITFTMDGKMMVLGLRAPYLALFLLSNHKLLKFITLPEHIQTVKHVDFIPQMNDGGSNKILAILSGRGSIYFYDIEQNIIISELISDYEISKFDYSVKGSYMACVSCSGDVNVYDIIQYIVMPVKLKAVRAEIAGKSVRLKKCLEKMGIVKEQIREILDIEKLRMILRECGEYPDTYRMKIWEHLLELPNNKDQYNAIIDNRMIVSFSDLCKKYPLWDKRNLKNLKKLLDNLVTWTPFFLHVDYLPVFVFPFVKVFHNKPLACFEAVCTVLVNWCQFWFEYFPLPPINVLAMIENMLLEHDPELLDHLVKNNISSKEYAWPILKTAFSEILTAPAWKAYWDHVLTNEPSFLLCGAVAYNIVQRAPLLNVNTEKQLLCFYHTHQPVDIKKLLAKTYHILNQTSPTIHPRQYLNSFKKIRPGGYPNLCGYPKTIINLKSEKSAAMNEEMKRLKTDEIDLFKKRLDDLDKMESFGVEEEENRRVLEMENAIKRQMIEEQEQIKSYYERLAKLRQAFTEEDKALATLKDKVDKEYRIERHERYLSSVLDDVTLDRKEKDYAMKKTEDELLFHYSELLRNKYQIEKLLDRDRIEIKTIEEPRETAVTLAKMTSKAPSTYRQPVFTSTKNEDNSAFLKQQQKLSEAINKVHKKNKTREHIKVLNLVTGIKALDSLINQVERELEKEKRGNVDENSADRRVLELQAETKDLVTEVNNLMKLLVDLRNVEVGG